LADVKHSIILPKSFYVWEVDLSLRQVMKLIEKAAKTPINSPRAIPIATITVVLQNKTGSAGGVLIWLIRTGSKFTLDKSTFDKSSIFEIKLKAPLICWSSSGLLFNIAISCSRASCPYKYQSGNDSFPLTSGLLKLFFTMPKFLAISRFSERSLICLDHFALSMERRTSSSRE
jgi:hypothetical protein